MTGKSPVTGQRSVDVGGVVAQRALQPQRVAAHFPFYIITLDLDLHMVEGDFVIGVGVVPAVPVGFSRSLHPTAVDVAPASKLHRVRVEHSLPALVQSQAQQATVLSLMLVGLHKSTEPFLKQTEKK